MQLCQSMRSQVMEAAFSGPTLCKTTSGMYVAPMTFLLILLILLLLMILLILQILLIWLILLILLMLLTF